MLRRNTWEIATKVCPVNVTQNLSGATDTALIHEPKAVPRAPKNIAHRKPYNKHNVNNNVVKAPLNALLTNTHVVGQVLYDSLLH